MLHDHQADYSLRRYVEGLESRLEQLELLLARVRRSIQDPNIPNLTNDGSCILGRTSLTSWTATSMFLNLKLALHRTLRQSDQLLPNQASITPPHLSQSCTLVAKARYPPLGTRPRSSPPI